MNRRAALPTPDEVHDAITALTEALGNLRAPLHLPNTSASRIPRSVANSPTSQQISDASDQPNRVARAPKTHRRTRSSNSTTPSSAATSRNSPCTWNSRSPISNDSALRTTAYGGSATKPPTSHPSPELDSGEHRAEIDTLNNPPRPQPAEVRVDPVRSGRQRSTARLPSRGVASTARRAGCSHIGRPSGVAQLQPGR